MVYYNEFINLLPNDNDYAAFFDADTIVTTPDYGCLIDKVIKEHPDIDMFTCYTNRLDVRGRFIHLGTNKQMILRIT